MTIYITPHIPLPVERGIAHKHDWDEIDRRTVWDPNETTSTAASGYARLAILERCRWCGKERTFWK